MRYVVQVRSGDDWKEFTDRHGEGREYDDPATAQDWITGASALPNSPEYRVFDRERPPPMGREPIDAREAVLLLLKRHGPMTDAEIISRLQQTSWHVKEFSESHFRTSRSHLVKMGMVRATGDRKITRRGRSSAVWDVNDG